MEASGAGTPGADGAAEQTTRPRGDAAGSTMDYWFDLSKEGSVRRCVTFGYGNQIDDRQTEEQPTTGRTEGDIFTGLITDALPAIKSDLDTYGLG